MYCFYNFILFMNDISEIKSDGHFDTCQVLCGEQPCRIFNTCNAEHKVSKQNQLFIQTPVQLAQNGLPTRNAPSVEIFFFLSYHSFNLRQPARSVLSCKFHCFTVYFVSLSFIYTNVCTCF